MKLYTTQIPSCTLCPNILIIPAISSDVLSQDERRCRAVTYRNNVYRLIHWDRAEGVPVWCPLEEAKKVEGDI